MTLRSTVALSTAAVIVSCQFVALRHKFPLFVSTPSKPAPVLLRVVAGIPVGFVHGHHGALFVRLPRGVNVVPSHAPAEMRKVEIAMLQELPWIPRKLVGEGVWYFTVLFLLIYLPIEQTWRRAASSSRFALTTGAIVFLGTVLIQVPIAFGYDGSIFSNWVGPGAYSYSRPYLRITGIPGVTVSYRTFLEAVIMPAAKLLLWFAPADAEISFWWFTCGVAGVYALAAASTAVVIASIVRRGQVEAAA